MQEKLYETTWHTLTNPFNTMGEKDVITGQISGRSTDIAEIITSGQSAIILTGAPSIGKSALLRYLQRSPEASWCYELASTLDLKKTKNIHFIPVDLEGIEDLNQLSEGFANSNVWQHYKLFVGKLSSTLLQISKA